MRAVGWAIAFGLALAASLAADRVADAAVPHDSAAPAYAEEQTVLQTEVGTPEPGWGSSASGRQHMDRHFLEPPGRMPEQNVVLQRGGNTWRILRNGPLATVSASVILLVLFGFALAWATVGPGHREPETGRTMPRFSRGQRITHWATAISFGLLALTGLVMLFGKKLILPWLGHEAFSWLAVIGKWVHNVVGPLFILCSLLLFLTFLRHNHWRREDWRWLRSGGGLFDRGAPPPAGYFNGGEKIWFWFGLTLLGLLMAATGLVLNFPYWGDVGFARGSTRYVQQIANVLHLLGASFYIAGAIGHTYLGTVGSPGAYRGMRDGVVDESWARHHHRLWYDEVRGTSVVDEHDRPIVDMPPADVRPVGGRRGAPT